MIGSYGSLFNRTSAIPPELLAMAGTAGAAPGVLPGPPSGGLSGDGPSTINLTDPTRYGARPSVYGGGPMASLAPPSVGSTVPASAAQASPSGRGGMFAAPRKGKLDVGSIIGAMLQAYLGMRAGMGDRGAQAMLPGIQQQMMYRLKQHDEDAQTAKYVQSLENEGLSPDQAAIMAADPTEMAKHFGTHYDQKVLNQGDTLATPNLNGSLSTYTAPAVKQNGADVLQMPGQIGVSQPFASLTPGAPPVSLGAPGMVPGLRTDAAQYAGDLGLSPGTPQFGNAIKDYTLKGNGPTAFGQNTTLQDARLANARTIAAAHDATSAANSVRSSNASRYATDHRVTGGAGHPLTTSGVMAQILDKMRQGQPLTPGEQAALAEARTPHKAERGGGVRVMTAQEAAQQPPGTVFQTTDGRIMRVPERR